MRAALNPTRPAFVALLVCLTSGLAACDEQATPASSASAQAATTAKPVTTVASTTRPATTTQPAAIKDDDIPTTADYEIEAAADIHPANADAELAALEKEIAAE